MSTHSANGLDMYVHGSELTILMTRLMVHHVNMMKISKNSTLQTVISRSIYGCQTLKFGAK